MSGGPPDSSTITSLLVAVGGALGIEVVKRLFTRPKEVVEEAAALRNEWRARSKDLLDENKGLNEDNKKLREECDRLRSANVSLANENRIATDRIALDAKSHAAELTAAHQNHVSILSAKEADIAALTEENSMLTVRVSDLQTQLRTERKRCYDLEKQLKLKR